MLKRILLSLYFLTEIFCFASQALTISPSVIVVETEPGVPQTGAVTVINDSKSEQTLRINMVDIIFDKSGKKKSIPVSPKNKNSIARYIEPSIRQTILKPGESKEVKLLFNLPPNIVGGNTAQVYFTLSPQRPKNFKTGYVMQLALGTTILQETKGTSVVKSRITDVNITQLTANKPANFEMKVINQGNTFLRATGVVSIISGEDSFLGSFSLDKIIIPPKRDSNFKQAIKVNLKPGKYNALVTYQYKDKSLSINKPFEIK